jgi:hypothetical protein
MYSENFISIPVLKNLLDCNLIFYILQS